VAFKAYLWGIESNLCGALLATLWYQFKAYLWGIESFKKSRCPRCAIKFKAYLWGIESSRYWRPMNVVNAFKAYLWGIERQRAYVIPIIHKFHLKPTYEGLKDSTCHQIRNTWCHLKPTYEGLKDNRAPLYPTRDVSI